MTDYEIIGRITVWIGACSLLLGLVLLLLRGAWFALKELYGWIRIAAAIQLLHEKERREEQLREDMT